VPRNNHVRTILLSAIASSISVSQEFLTLIPMAHKDDRKSWACTAVIHQQHHLVFQIATLKYVDLEVFALT